MTSNIAGIVRQLMIKVPCRWGSTVSCVSEKTCTLSNCSSAKPPVFKVASWCAHNTHSTRSAVEKRKGSEVTEDFDLQGKKSMKTSRVL